MVLTRSRRQRQPGTTLPVAVSRITGGLLVSSGLWAMIAPRSFFKKAATFDPYNQHFIQDIGAFQIGLGAVLVLAAFVSNDALAIGLLGVGVGSTAHTMSHVVGLDLGGKPRTDIPTFAVLAALLLFTGMQRLRELRDRPHDDFVRQEQG